MFGTEFRCSGLPRCSLQTVITFWLIFGSLPSRPRERHAPHRPAYLTSLYTWCTVLLMRPASLLIVGDYSFFVLSRDSSIVGKSIKWTRSIDDALPHLTRVATIAAVLTHWVIEWTDDSVCRPYVWMNEFISCNKYRLNLPRIAKN